MQFPSDHMAWLLLSLFMRGNYSHVSLGYFHILEVIEIVGQEWVIQECKMISFQTDCNPQVVKRILPEKRNIKCPSKGYYCSPLGAKNHISLPVSCWLYPMEWAVEKEQWGWISGLATKWCGEEVSSFPTSFMSQEWRGMNMPSEWKLHSCPFSCFRWTTVLPPTPPNK